MKCKVCPAFWLACFSCIPTRHVAFICACMLAHKVCLEFVPACRGVSDPRWSGEASRPCRAAWIQRATGLLTLNANLVTCLKDATRHSRSQHSCFVPLCRCCLWAKFKCFIDMVWMSNGLEFTWGSFLLHTSTSAFPDSTEEPELTSWGNSMADWGTGRASGQQQN